MIMPKDPPDEKVPQAQLDELNRKLARITQAYNTFELRAVRITPLFKAFLRFSLDS